MVTASVTKGKNETASVSVLNRSHSSDCNLKNLAKALILTSAGMLYQCGNYNEEMAYAARAAYAE